MFVRACWPPPDVSFMKWVDQFKRSQKCHSLPVAHLHRCSSSGRLSVAPAVGPLGMHSIETLSKAETKVKWILPRERGQPDQTTFGGSLGSFFWTPKAQGQRRKNSFLEWLLPLQKNVWRFCSRCKTSKIFNQESKCHVLHRVQKWACGRQSVTPCYRLCYVISETINLSRS